MPTSAERVAAVYWLDHASVEAARVHGARLVTRDHRARRTYDLIGVQYELLG
jgi:hypothetical protein